ncbi:MAG TPA: SDR family oxidoreductase, partial [Parafilimonas sp.]
LGKAIAEKYAEAGNHLIICSRNEEALLKAKEELLKKNSNCKVEVMAIDLKRKENAIAFGNFCLQFGTPEILINNAGSFLPGSIHTEKEGVLEKMIEVNLFSAYHLTKILLPKMMEARNGHIFNMCSIASVAAYSNGGSYSISKFALLGFNKNLREEMKPYNIKVTAVIPGAVYTDSWSGTDVKRERIMQPDDIATLIYAASKLSPQACVEEILLRPQLGDL